MLRGKIKEFLETTMMKWRSVVILSEIGDPSGNHFIGRYSTVDSIPTSLLHCYVINWDVDSDNILIFV